MNFYRSVLGGGSIDYSASYTVTAVKNDNTEELCKGSCYGLFNNANNSSTYIIGNNVQDCRRAFDGGYGGEFNQNVTIPSSVLKCDQMFVNCYNLNQNIFVPDTVLSCKNMFENCSILNQNIHISNSVSDLSYMFSKSGINQSIRIPSNVKNCCMMFRYCNSFNKSITIPNGVLNCFGMFYYSYNYNQSITIPSSVTNCTVMFCYCEAFGGDGKNIYINMQGRTTMPNLQGMLTGRNYSKRINIFCKNVNIITDNSRDVSTCIIDQTIRTWTQQTNGYYSSAYNIYLYNNYNG